jgi:hypothetical protein
MTLLEQSSSQSPVSSTPAWELLSARAGGDRSSGLNVNAWEYAEVSQPESASTGFFGGPFSGDHGKHGIWKLAPALPPSHRQRPTSERSATAPEPKRRSGAPVATVAFRLRHRDARRQSPVALSGPFSAHCAGWPRFMESDTELDWRPCACVRR